jgi:hypothetical protein
MKIKILLGIAIFLTVFLITVRVIYLIRFENFKKSLIKYEIDQHGYFMDQKAKKLFVLAGGDKNILNAYIKSFDEKQSIIEKDTFCSFLYISNYLKFSIYSIQYIECLEEKCRVDIEKDSLTNSIKEKEIKLHDQYGSFFSQWYPLIKHNIIANKSKPLIKCNSFFPDYYDVTYNVKAWDEFGTFLETYKNEYQLAESNNYNSQKEFETAINKTRSQLQYPALDLFDKDIAEKKNQILNTDSLHNSFNGSMIGIIKYDIETTLYNDKVFQSIADKAFEENWKTNSLSNGSMPYSNCYGSNNRCTGWACSHIKVTSGGSDVIVFVKNAGGRVIRHGYIKSSRSMTFDIPNGLYQVFFYSGTGWNPNKIIYNGICDDLKGGFVSNERFSKDEYVQLTNHLLTYELMLQQDGNFNAKTSSRDEAFN